jgi:hypothetical protein
MADAEEGGTRTAERHGIPVWLWAVLVLLLLYPLSIGPAAKFLDDRPGTRTEKVLDVVYAPLGYVCEHFSPAGKLFQWYVVELWRADIE